MIPCKDPSLEMSDCIFIIIIYYLNVDKSLIR